MRLERGLFLALLSSKKEATYFSILKVINDILCWFYTSTIEASMIKAGMISRKSARIIRQPDCCWVDRTYPFRGCFEIYEIDLTYSRVSTWGPLNQFTRSSCHSRVECSAKTFPQLNLPFDISNSYSTWRFPSSYLTVIPRASTYKEIYILLETYFCSLRVSKNQLATI